MRQERRSYLRERIAAWDVHVVNAAGMVARRPCKRATTMHALCVTNAAQWRARLKREEAGEPPIDIN